MSSANLNSPALVRLNGAITALVLTLLLASWLLPASLQQNMHQLDFWLAWLLCMLFIALPFTLLEIALAKRSQAVPLAAIAVLTREADTKPTWRITAWLAAGLTALVSGGLVFHASQTLVASQQPHLGQLSTFIPALLVLLALGLSFVPRFVLLLVAALTLLASIVLNVLHGDVAGWQWTPFSLQEWAWVVVLTLVSTGLGYGLYWQLAAQASAQRAAQWALPVWGAQVAAGVILALSAGLIAPPASSVLLVAALLAAAATLVGLLREQLQARGVALALQWLFVLAGLLLWLLPVQPLFTLLTGLLGLVVCLLYAIFAGWQMKISHLRKALNFEQELVYNLWRVMVRVAIPLALIIAMIGWLLPV